MPRTPNAAFMRPLKPDAVLAAIVGPDPLSRPEITKRLWAYIRGQGLQDATNRRQINADERLRPFFGGRESVTMLELPACVSAHVSPAS